MRVFTRISYSSATANRGLDLCNKQLMISKLCSKTVRKLRLCASFFPKKLFPTLLLLFIPHVLCTPSKAHATTFPRSLWFCRGQFTTGKSRCVLLSLHCFIAFSKSLCSLSSCSSSRGGNKCIKCVFYYLCLSFLDYLFVFLVAFCYKNFTTESRSCIYKMDENNGGINYAILFPFGLHYILCLHDE